MFGQETFINKKILIYGLGLSGKSCFKYLYKKNNITVYDDNDFLKNKKNKNYFLGKSVITKKEFDYIVLSPGIDIKKCKQSAYSDKFRFCNFYYDDCLNVSTLGKCNERSFSEG